MSQTRGIVVSSRADIQRAVRDDRWQVFRVSLKGLSTGEKLKRLREYRRRHDTEKARIQVENYVNALKRAGLK